MIAVVRKCAALAAVAGLGTSAMAAPLPSPRAELHVAIAQPSAHHGGWGRRHGDGGGDVLAGVLIFGGIAALVGVAASSAKQHDAERARSAPPSRSDAPPPQRYDDRRDADPREATPGPGQGEDLLDRAVNACADAASHDGEVDRIDDAYPGAGGFHIEGALKGGRGFNCTADAEGTVREVHTGPRSGHAGRYDPSAAERDSDTEDRASDAYETARAPAGEASGPA